MVKVTSFCYSFSVTGTLGVVRCIAICSPFTHINKKVVIILTVFFYLFTIGMTTADVVMTDHRWSPFVMSVGSAEDSSAGTTIPATFLDIKHTANMVVSLVCAVISFIHLKMHPMTASSPGREASTTIALLNVLIVVEFLFFLVVQSCSWGMIPRGGIVFYYLTFLKTPFWLFQISAVNPLIYITRSTKMRALLSRNKGGKKYSSQTEGRTDHETTAI